MDKIHERKVNKRSKAFKLLKDNLELQSVGEKKQKKEEEKDISQKASLLSLNPL